MMNQEIKARWVDALRSGNYIQSKHWLNKGGTFCCLGVLCEVVKEEVDLQVNTILQKQINITLYNGVPSTLPEEVKNYTGLDVTNPCLRWVNEKGVVHDLTCISANDEEGLSFCEIADLIEEQL